MKETLIYLAGVPFDAVPGSDRRMVEALSQHIRVLWVDPPISVLTPLRHADARRTVGQARLREVAHGIFRLSVITVPRPHRARFRRVAAWSEHLAISRSLRRIHGRAEGVVVSSAQPRSAGTWRVPWIYWATDDFAAGADLLGLSAEDLCIAEAEQLTGCDAVLAVTPGLAERLAHNPAYRGSGVDLLPNGVSVSAYESVEDVAAPLGVAADMPWAGVVGQLSDRIDLRMLEAVSAAGVSILLVGPFRPVSEPDRWRQFLDRPDVMWVGEQPFETLPSYLGAMRVGLTPYVDTAFNRMSYPLKTLEYLAAGLPVVSSDLPASRLLGPDVITASSPDEFGRAVSALAAEPVTADARARRRAVAGKHTWDHRAGALLETISRSGARLGADRPLTH